MDKSRLCVAVDADGEEKGSGVLTDSVAVMAENSTDPRRLLGAVIADSYLRHEPNSTNYWRVMVGVCYMHAMMVADMETTSSCVFYDSPALSLQCLLHTARILTPFQHHTKSNLLRIVRMLVGHVSYRTQFQRPHVHLVELLDGCLSSRLFAHSDFLVVFDKIVESPDQSQKGGWGALLRYSHTLCNKVHVPWHLQLAPCLVVDNHFERSIKRCELLQKTKRPNDTASSTIPDHHAVLEFAQTIFNMLPTTHVVQLEAPNSEMTFPEITLQTMLIHEFDHVRERVNQVEADLTELLHACKGLAPFDTRTHSLYSAMNENRVSERWDAFASAGRCPVKWFVEELKERFLFFHAKLCAYGMSRGPDIKLQPATPLYLFSRPTEILDLHVLAWQCAQSTSLSHQLSLSPRHLRFGVVSGPPIGENNMRLHPMAKGLLVSNLVFRCAKFNAQTVVLEELPTGVHTFGDVCTEYLNLEVLDLDQLPARATMKHLGISKEPYILSKEPHILLNEPYKQLQEPCIVKFEASKENYMLSNEPNSLSKKPYSQTQRS